MQMEFGLFARRAEALSITLPTEKTGHRVILQKLRLIQFAMPMAFGFFVLPVVPVFIILYPGN